MKKLLVLYSENDWEESVLKLDYNLVQSYKILYSELLKRNIELYRANFKWFNGEDFIKSWKYSGDSWEKSELKIKPDIIFDKTSPFTEEDILNLDLLKVRVQLSHKFQMINPPDFTSLISNKLYQSIIFREFLPKTITSLSDIHELKTSKVVVKKFQGSSAKFVNIVNRDDVKEISKDMLVQEFVDGIDSNDDLFDYRFVYVNQDLVFVETRKAAKDSEYTNCSKGATNKILYKEEIDNSLLEFAGRIAKQLEIFKDVTYSIDLMIDHSKGKKIFLIEINSKPGLGLFQDNKILTYDSKTEEIYRSYYSKLLDTINLSE